MRTVTLLLLLVLCGCASQRAWWEFGQTARDPVLTDPEDNPWIYPGILRVSGMHRELAERAYRAGWEAGLRQGRYPPPSRLNGPALDVWEKAYRQGVFAGAAYSRGRDGQWITDQLDRDGW